MRARHITAVSLVLLASAATAAATAAWAAVTKVDQVGQKFSQAALAIRAADHIAFMNQDDVQHNIKLIDAAGTEDDKGLQKPGETIDVTFAKAGKYMVRCAIHPKMKMTVDVQ